MTLHQALAFGLIGVTVGFFIWGRIAYDLIALAALVVGIAIGLIPAHHAFEGFSNEIVVIVGAALVVSAVIARSGVVESLMRPVLPYLRTTQTQVPVLVGCVMLLSMVTKNVGALAIFMPIALQVARRTATSPSSLLMPMSFASLIGGLVTLVGTAPNIIISNVRAETAGKPFSMFDFTPVGLGVCAIGILFLSFGWRLLPGGRKAAASMDAAFTIEHYTAEARVPADSPMIGQTIRQLEILSEGDVRVAGIVRERYRRHLPTPNEKLRANDVLLLRGETDNLERLIARAKLAFAAGSEVERGEVHVVEGVVTENSPLIGRTPSQLSLRERYNIGLLAVSRRGETILQRLATVRFKLGDVVVLRSVSSALPERLGELRVLPLAERSISLGRNDRSWIPAIVLAIAMGLVAFRLVEVQVAFVAAAVILLLMRFMTMHEAYQAMEWHILILLGALIPISHAIKETGGTDLLAGWLTDAVQGVSPTLALGMVLVLTLIVTPFLHNAPTVLVLGPVAATLANKLHLNPDSFLMAVALGAGCDFLTPIGHQCNTLVLGPGGYKFADYARLGFPLTILIVLAGVPLISFFWPLHPG